MRDVFIYEAARTPRGRGKAGKGALSGVHPQELLAQTLNRVADKAGLDKRLVEDVTIGCVTQVKEQGACIARNAIIAAGWPDDVTGNTVNRFCGSGLQAVNFAAMGIASGAQEVTIGGGVESMSRVPMGSDGAMIAFRAMHAPCSLTWVTQPIAMSSTSDLSSLLRSAMKFSVCASNSCG